MSGATWFRASVSAALFDMRCEVSHSRRRRVPRSRGVRVTVCYPQFRSCVPDSPPSNSARSSRGTRNLTTTGPPSLRARRSCQPTKRWASLRAHPSQNPRYIDLNDVESEAWCASYCCGPLRRFAFYSEASAFWDCWP